MGVGVGGEGGGGGVAVLTERSATELCWLCRYLLGSVRRGRVVGTLSSGGWVATQVGEHQTEGPA